MLEAEVLFHKREKSVPPTTLNKIIPLEIRSPLSSNLMQCMGAQMHGCTKKGEGVHWLALACTDLILCAHDLILCYGWYHRARCSSEFIF